MLWFFVSSLFKFELSLYVMIMHKNGLIVFSKWTERLSSVTHYLCDLSSKSRFAILTQTKNYRA